MFRDEMRVDGTKLLMGLESRRCGGDGDLKYSRTAASIFLSLLCAYHCTQSRGTSQVETSPRCLAISVVQAARFPLSAPSNVCFLSEGVVPRTIARRKSGAT
jgi:hypothetical protein